jgi:hypothetical protein
MHAMKAHKQSLTQQAARHLPIAFEAGDHLPGLSGHSIGAAQASKVCHATAAAAAAPA